MDDIDFSDLIPAQRSAGDAPFAPIASSQPSPHLAADGGTHEAAARVAFDAALPPADIDFSDLLPPDGAPQDIAFDDLVARPSPADFGTAMPQPGVYPDDGTAGSTFPSAVHKVGRAVAEGAQAGFGTAPIGFSPENREKYPRTYSTWQPFVAPIDFTLRAPGAVIGGAAAGAGELYKQLGGNEAWGNRLTRDLGVIGQGTLIESGALLPRAAEAIPRRAFSTPQYVEDVVAPDAPRRAAQSIIPPPDSPATAQMTARAASAIDHVIATEGSVVGAIRRDDLGPITIDWGEVGNPAKGFSDGWGVSHIIARRNLEGLDGERFVREVVPHVLAEGAIVARYGPQGGERVNIVLGNAQATLSLYRYRERETWLLTSFYLGKGGFR
jgi:hypothetical protein